MTDFARTMVGGVSMPRLLVGTNWFLGYSHTSRAQDKFIRNLQTRERVADILTVFSEAGVDAIMGPHFTDALGQAVALMLVQATALGLVARQMGGFNQDKARATLNIPDDYDPVAGIALGYPGDTEKLPSELQAAEKEPRQRKGLEDFVWSGVFGASMSFKSRAERPLKGD